jgi:tRNA A-37 threonylcarbamoyl transferase component Bud32
VFDALWKGRPVILKLYTNTSASSRQLKNEWNNLSLLHVRKVHGPEPLFYGLTESGQWALIMEKITEATSAYKMWLEKKSSPSQLEYMLQVLKALGKQHEKGIIQKDLQLDNFIFKNDTLYPLDAYQMSFFKSPVSRKTSIDQVALLASQYRETVLDFQGDLLDMYGQVRGWSFTEKERKFFKNRVDDYIQVRLKKRVKKCLRANRRHMVLKKAEFFGVFDRRLFKDFKEAEGFIENLDTLMDAGHILKRGNSCHLSRITWKGWELVVKRYNKQGILHALRVTLGQSRARICWANAIRLNLLQIPTPRPLAFIDKRSGRLIHTSYFVTEYIPSITCRDYLLDKNVPESKKQENVKVIIDMLNRLEHNKISHGDMKHLNFLISDKGPFLIDLDGMRFHRWLWTFSRSWDKDMSRFRKNWDKSPELAGFFRDFLVKI